jgi:hypothetical protein
MKIGSLDLPAAPFWSGRTPSGSLLGCARPVFCPVQWGTCREVGRYQTVLLIGVSRVEASFCRPRRSSSSLMLLPGTTHVDSQDVDQVRGLELLVVGRSRLILETCGGRDAAQRTVCDLAGPFAHTLPWLELAARRSSASTSSTRWSPSH